ncbi:MAG: trehalase family glycosidase [bacterium]
MKYDIRQIPFSARGSYVTIMLSKDNQLAIRTASDFGLFKSDKAADIFTIRPGVDSPTNAKVKCTPYELVYKKGESKLKIHFYNAETLLFSWKGYPLTFASEQSINLVKHPAGYLLSLHRSGCYYAFVKPINAKIKTDIKIPIKSKTIISHRVSLTFIPDDNSTVNLAVKVSRYEKSAFPSANIDYEKSLRKARKNWEWSKRKLPEISARYKNTRDLAWYSLWGNLVTSEGRFKRETNLCSKYIMSAIWSWDNCFGALGFLPFEPELARDQILTIFDRQAKDGMLPDGITDEREFRFGTKPPVHGWTILKFIKEKKAPLKFIKEIYSPLIKWTRWWLDNRDYDRDGIYQYNLSNESGWDNNTVFNKGMPVEAPDLNAYLALQMEAISKMSSLLGKTKVAEEWMRESKTLIKRLIEHSWDSDKGIFISYRDSIHDYEETDSLMGVMPLVLGSRLPKEIIDKMTKKLMDTDTLMSKYGPVTVSLKDSAFDPACYWRGSIWAPTVYLLHDGLVSAGKNKEAEIIARRFITLVSKNKGMFEDYNPLTGEGNDNACYNWTGAVTLIFLLDYYVSA